MARSLLERLKNTIRDNLLDFLEVDSLDSPLSLNDLSPSEILSRLKLRLGAIEAERYRLAELLTSEHDHGQYDGHHPRSVVEVCAGGFEIVQRSLAKSH